MIDFAIGRRFRKRSVVLLTIYLFGYLSRRAYASAILFNSDCSKSSDGLGCHLLGLLNFLYFTASVLALVLIVVVIVAVKSYRRNSKDDERRS